MLPNRIITIGASAGGVQSLTALAASLPANLDAAVFVVLHIPPNLVSTLPQILSKQGSLPAVHPMDGDPIKAGIIYVAPPDHHLLVEGNRILIKRGPKENRNRPSIDALFRSAAYSHGASGAVAGDHMMWKELAQGMQHHISGQLKKRAVSA